MLLATLATWHVTSANLRVEQNSSAIEITKLHLSHTKVAPLDGENVYWS